MFSDEDENDASEKADMQHHHDARSEADALSLFGGGDIDEMTILSSRIWRMETLTTLVVVCSQLFPELFTGHRSANCKWPC